MKRTCDDPIRAAEKTARGLGRALFRALFWRGFLPASGAAAFVAGGAVLVLRLSIGYPRPELLAGIVAAALLAALLRGVLYARTRLPDSRRLLVWLDGASRCGGLLATSLETDPGAWRKSVAPPSPPRVTVSAGSGLAVSVFGLLFLAGAVFFPESAVGGRVRRTLDFSAETAALEEKIEVLEEESLMPEKELADLKSGVAELKDKNDAANPARLFELFDALSRRVGLAGDAAASRLREDREAQRMLAETLDALGALPPERLSSSAAAQLGELLRKLAEENPELAELLKRSGCDGSPDPEAMKRLAEALRDSSGKLEKQLARLVEAKLAKSGGAKPGSGRGGGKGRGSGSGSGDGELAEWLARNAPGADELCKTVAACMAPGNGGVTRGRGDAPLTFTGNTAGSGGREVDLALAGDNDPSRSMSVQQFAAAPNPAPGERRAAAAGQLRGGDARVDRGETPIYPAHRAAVERYFKPKGERNTP